MWLKEKLPIRGGEVDDKVHLEKRLEDEGVN